MAAVSSTAYEKKRKDERVPTKCPALARTCMPALLATTSVAALLLATPAPAGQAITGQTVATVTNPAGHSTTSIVITGSTVTGAVTNAGTITPGKVGVNGSVTGLAVINSRSAAAS